MIWPSAHGCYVKGDVAVFVGDKARKERESGKSWPMTERLFAVRAPEPPLDITDAVWRRWSKESGRGLAKTLKWADIVYTKENSGRLELHCCFHTTESWPDTIIMLDWKQIADMMRDVKEQGVLRKDVRWNTTYIEKTFQPEE